MSPREVIVVDDGLGLDALAGELREHTGATVSTVGELPPAPPGDAVLVVSASALAPALNADEPPAELLRRVVVAGTDRTVTLELLEEHGLAAAIQDDMLIVWGGPGIDAESGRAVIVGRLDVARAMGAEIIDSPFATARYGPLAVDRLGLGALLAAYLSAYAERC